VSLPRTTALKIGAVVFVLTAVSLLLVRSLRGRGPYDVESVELSGWTLEASPPGEPALVALRPPAPLSTSLFQQLFKRTGEALVAAPRPSVPLVLREEYADSLQGVLTVEDIVDTARDVGLESARFEPVCLGRRRASAGGRADELFFVVFNAPLFDRFRDQLTPLFPEHAGAFPYEPKALRPILTIAGSDREFARWWPIAVKTELDCLASFRVTD
jgi:hypothetical protein